MATLDEILAYNSQRPLSVQEQRELALRARQQQNAEAQARADAMLQQRQPNFNEQTLAREQQQALAEQARRGELQKLGTEYGYKSKMADAESRARAAELSQRLASERDMASVDFANQDKMARLASELQKGQLSQRYGLDAEKEETNYLRKRNSEFSEALAKFGPMTKRLSPDGQAKYAQMKKQLDVLDKAYRVDHSMDEKTYLRQRSAWADDFAASGLGAEVAPYGQMPGDIVDRGIMQHQLGPDGKYEPIGVRQNITQEELDPYFRNLPPGTGYAIDPTTGKPTIVQPRAAGAGAGGLTEKDIQAARAKAIEYLRSLEDNNLNPIPFTDQDIQKEMNLQLGIPEQSAPPLSAEDQAVSQFIARMPNNKPMTQADYEALPAAVKARMTDIPPPTSVPSGLNTQGLPTQGMPVAPGPRTLGPRSSQIQPTVPQPGQLGGPPAGTQPAPRPQDLMGPMMTGRAPQSAVPQSPPRAMAPTATSQQTAPTLANEISGAAKAYGNLREPLRAQAFMAKIQALYPNLDTADVAALPPELQAALATAVDTVNRSRQPSRKK